MQATQYFTFDNSNSSFFVPQKLCEIKFTGNETCAKHEIHKTSDIGFIAEEVDKVIPELVCWDEKHELVQGVKYANIVAVAVEGIKSQQKQIEDLQKENSSLRDDLTSFKSQIDDLTAKIEKLAK